MYKEKPYYSPPIQTKKYFSNSKIDNTNSLGYVTSHLSESQSGPQQELSKSLSFIFFVLCLVVREMKFLIWVLKTYFTIASIAGIVVYSIPRNPNQCAIYLSQNGFFLVLDMTIQICDNLNGYLESGDMMEYSKCINIKGYLWKLTIR